MDERVINNIRSLGIDMIDAAGSGHPGIVLGAAPIIYTLYSRHMEISISDHNWLNRDRFVLSAGHGSAMLYATLFLAGYNISLDDIKNFRRQGYKTPGHPEYGVTPGVDVSTGPLGQGIATAVGMAIGEKMLSAKFMIPSKHPMLVNKPLIDYRVYVLCGDGDLMEGISYEAVSLAGTLKLDNLIVLYDSNHISLDGSTGMTFTENVIDRFKSMGWHTDTVSDGSKVDSIDRAITIAKKSGKPSMIEIKTIIGHGSAWANTNTVHGKPLEETDIRRLKNMYHMKEDPFFIDEEACNYFRKQISERSINKYNLWTPMYNDYKKSIKLDSSETPDLYLNPPKSYSINNKWSFEKNTKENIREVNSAIIKEISKQIPMLIGGSADVASSTKAYITDSDNFSSTNLKGRNIAYGVREHAMGAITNGLALTNFRPFCSTFFAFSDYLKPAIRMACLMDLPVTYIFTHDSINIGQDGPTHQPIEQLASLRAIPNLYVYRPADAVELVGCWNSILALNKPSTIVLSRQDMKNLDNTSFDSVKYGAYIVKKEKSNLHGIIISTGSEVSTAELVASKILEEEGIDLRVVSMPSMELFLLQQEEYKKLILPEGVKTIVIEAGSSLGWFRFVYNEKYLITIDKFGISGTKDEVEAYTNFTFNEIKSRIKKLFK